MWVIKREEFMSIKAVLVFVLASLCFSSGFAARPEYKIVTASERGTYIAIGRDLAKYVAEAADINLMVLPSNGSVENVSRLRDERGTKLALVQSDVYQAFLNQASAGNPEAARIINPLRVIAPLYDEEIYFVVRADSPLNFIHEIADKKINIGKLGSGSAMSASIIYRLMFNVPMAEENVTTMGNEEALLKLVRDKSIDVAVVVAGQPTPLFLEVEPGVEKYFKLLKLDPTAPAAAKTLNAYPLGTIRAGSYPQWLKTDVLTYAVKTFLVTYNYNEKQTIENLARFGTALCKNFSKLQTEGHPKWKQVNLNFPALGENWRYFEPTRQSIGKCMESRRCPLESKIMGFCKD